MWKLLKTGFAATVPVLLGYLSVGTAFGLLMVKSGFPAGLAVLMSLVIFAGSMQFVAIQLMLDRSGLVNTALVTLFVNIRHMFYGLSFLDRYKGYGKAKGYMVFSLTDETYSVLSALPVEEKVDVQKLQLLVSVMNHAYWIAGTALGALAGELLDFNTEGMEFAMTALFIVIFLEQWRAYKKHLPALVGLLSGTLALAVFGKANMVLGAMVLMTALLMGARKWMEGRSNG